MKNDAGDLIATSSIDEDQEVDSLTAWDENIAPAGELARLCVREDMQNQGIAKEMMRYAFDCLLYTSCLPRVVLLVAQDLKY